MQKELGRVIEQVSREKGIDRSLIIEAVEEAMRSAARKTYGQEMNLEAKYNPDTGEVEVYQIQIVVAEAEDLENEISLEDAQKELDPEAQIGDELVTRLDEAPLGRIAAQAAKQNIVQKVRDYERAMIYNEFKEHEGTIQSGIVMRFERRSLIVQLRPNVDAILPEKEQIPRERYRQGDRLRALIIDVSETARGPQIVLSRTSPELVRKLFAQEVPEVYEGIVEIKDVVREPGGRAKIAVVSHDSDVDPVGACVGMRGSRVQAVVQELRGERIDIVPWTPDETEFVCRALSPAKVSRIVIDEDAHAMEVVVPDDQLSLAIGRKGQNVRLGGKLTQWKLDVHSESEYEKRLRETRKSLRRIDGLGDFRSEMLLADGYKSAAEVAASSPEDVAGVLEVSVEEASVFVVAAKAAAEAERLEKMVLRIAAGVSEAALAMRAEAEAAESSTEAADSPAEVADSPAEVADSPVETADSPVETADSPVETADSPVETADSPVETADSPGQAGEHPEPGTTAEAATGPTSKEQGPEVDP